MAERITNDDQLRAAVKELSTDAIYVRRARRRGLTEGRPREEIVAEASSATLEAFGGKDIDRRQVEGFFGRQITGASGDGYIKTEAELDRLLQTFVRDGRSWVTDPRDRDEPDPVLHDAYEKLLKQIGQRLHEGITEEWLRGRFRWQLPKSGVNVARQEHQYMTRPCLVCSPENDPECRICNGTGKVLTRRVLPKGTGQDDAHDERNFAQSPLDLPVEGGFDEPEAEREAERLIRFRRTALTEHLRSIRLGLLDIRHVRADWLLRRAIQIETATELEDVAAVDFGQVGRAASFGGVGPMSADRRTHQMALIDSVALVYDPPSADAVDNSRTKSFGRWLRELRLDDLKDEAES